MSERKLDIIWRKWGLVGRCSSCKRIFRPIAERGNDLRHEAQEREIRAVFDSHKCEELIKQSKAATHC